MATGRSIKCRADSASKRAEPLFDPPDQLLVAVAGREDDGVLDRVRQPGMALAHPDHAEDVPARLHPHRLAGLAVGDHEIVLAGARIVAKDRDAAIERVGFFQDHPDQEGHRHTVPVAHPAPAHLADRDPLGVHPRDRADEAGVGHVHERDLAAGLGDRQDRVLLEPPVAAVIEDPAVVERPVLGRRAAERETRTVEQLGDEVGDDDVLDVQSRAVGNPAHLVEEALGDEFPLLGHDSLDHPLGIEQLDTRPARP